MMLRFRFVKDDYGSLDLVLAAFLEAADRSVAVLFLALRRVWREMAAVEAALCPSRRNAPTTARERFADGRP
jgi:hypothetical protein